MIFAPFMPTPRLGAIFRKARWTGHRPRRSSTGSSTANIPDFPILRLWAAIHRQTGRFIGRCGFILWTIDGSEETEIAYLLDKSFWGQGLGAEAAAALVRHGFERLKLPRLIALIDPGNTASKRTAEKAGLRFERVCDIEGGKAHHPKHHQPIVLKEPGTETFTMRVENRLKMPGSRREGRVERQRFIAAQNSLANCHACGCR